MAWFELHQELCAHPKTKRLAKALGASLPQTVGHCICLWSWAMSYAQDGDLTIYSEDDIADAAQWEGDPARFVQAMLDCGIGGKAGFFERSNGFLLIHDWEDYAGKYIEKRDREKLRQREIREQKRIHKEIERLQQSQETLPQVTQNVHSTLPQHTSNVATHRREEESREDKRTEEYPEVAPAGAAPSPEPAPEPVLELDPAPEPKTKRARAVTEGGQADMFGAIAETCQLDARLKAGQIAKTAKALLGAGYTPAQVSDFPSWWKVHDWRGQRGNTPTVGQLTELIKQSVNGSGASPPLRANGNGQYRTLGERQSEDYQRKMNALLGD